MTTESNLSAVEPGRNPTKAGNEPARSSEPPTIQITMPEKDTSPQAAGQPAAEQASMNNIEALLGKLMGRLDESDHRYSSALNDLNQRLNELSERAQSARGAQRDNSGAALDRVREQASSLAAQVNEAGAAHRAQHDAPRPGKEQRPGGDSGAHDADPAPCFGDTRLNDDFAEVTQRLERSLAARAPASDFDILTQRMDDLAYRFDSALATKNDLAALQAIESQLTALTSGFTDARQNYARVEAIEGHLASLMNWARSTPAPGQPSGDDKRLDAIEQALAALNENAREMDARTVGTLEAMNEALHSLATNMGASDTPQDDRDDAPSQDDHEQPPPAEAKQPSAEDYAEVWIDEKSGLDNAVPRARQEAPHEPISRATPKMDQLGAAIPDFQPAPGKKSEGMTPAPRDTAEPTFEAKNDFIASARRAAAAAASQEPAPRPAKASKRSEMPLAGMDLSGGKRTRPVLVIAAVALLLVSAGLLYARLKTQSSTPVIGTSQIIPPQTPVTAPSQPPGKAPPPVKPEASAPAAPKQHSQRMLNAPAPRPASMAFTERQSISTATLLASLPPASGQQQMPGVSVEIKEPATRAPAPRSHSAVRATAPALVPPAQTAPRAALMPPPKRAPAPGASSRPKHAITSPVDSARANEVPRAAVKRKNGMPPVRIGPYSLRNAAARGNPAAQVEIASRFAKGTGVPKSLKKASQWYTRAAAQGFAPGQYRLAALYERGQGVKKDTGMARTWYRRAAELGNVRAMHNLAVLYTRPGSRAPDYSSAKNWFLEAARRGLADSQFNLGILYESGLGAKKNIAEAYKWFTLAARSGDDEARKRREALRPKLSARALSAAQKIIQRWKPATVNEAANRAGPPRGGWRNASIKKRMNPGGPALIAKTQILLNKLGYDAGVPDGKLGPQTVAAIRRFEERTGITRTGKATSALLQRLEALSS